MSFLYPSLKPSIIYLWDIPKLHLTPQTINYFEWNLTKLWRYVITSSHADSKRHQVDFICLNVFASIWPLIDASVKLYKCMILPVFTYCSILTNIFTKSFEEKVSKFEKRAYTGYYLVNTSILIISKKYRSIRTLQKRRLCEQGYYKALYNILNVNKCSQVYNACEQVYKWKCM